jgi:SOS-response transcriptional repressor LexA
MPTGVPRAGDTKFEVLAAVVDHWGGARYGPTVGELTTTVGLNARSTVQFHINDLLVDGYIVHVPGKPRTISATRKGKKLVKVVRELEVM